MKKFAVITQSKDGKVKVHAQVAKFETAQRQVYKLLSKFSFGVFYGSDPMKILDVISGQTWNVVK